MKITLEYVATLKISDPASGSEVELPPGARVTDLLVMLNILPQHQKVIAPFINNIKVRLDAEINGGDRVFLAMPVGGG